MNGNWTLVAVLAFSVACRAEDEPARHAALRDRLLALAARRAGGEATFDFPGGSANGPHAGSLDRRLARDVEAAALQDGSGEALVDLGLLQIARGDARGAIATLQRANGLTGDARTATLLAAAQLWKASVEDDPLDLLAATEHLLGLPDDAGVEANRKLAFARLELEVRPLPPADELDSARLHAGASLAAWLTASAAADRPAASRALATMRPAAQMLDRIGHDREALGFLASISGEQAEQTRYAAAVARYFTAFREFDAFRIESAEPALRAARAELAAYGSPFVEWCDLYLLACRFHRRQLQGVVPEAERLGRAAALGLRRTLAGRAFWLQGVALLQSGRPIEARRALEESSGHFAAARAHGLEGFIEGLRAECSSLLGDSRAAWKSRLRGLDAQLRAGSPQQVATLMIEDSRAAGEAGFLRVALAYARRAVVIADELPSEVGRVEARLRLAEAAAFAGSMEAARQALDSAEAALTRVDSDQLRRNLAVRAALATSRVIGGQAPEEAIRRISAALATPEGNDPELLRLELLTRRAALLRATREFGAARADLEQALVLLSRQTGGPLDDATRIRARDRARGLYDELVALKVDQGAKGADVLDAIRRARRSALATGGGGDERHTQAAVDGNSGQLDEASVVVVLWSLPAETIALTMTSTGVSGPTRLPMPRAVLSARAAEIRRLLALHEDLLLEAAAADLSTMLIGPIWSEVGARTKLFILGDAEIESVVWELLPTPEGVPLGEHFRLAFLPDLDGRSEREETPPGRDVLVVADPAFAGGAGVGLPRLARARQEGEEVAARFPGAMLLVDRAATEARLVAELDSGRFRWLHVAAHVLPGFDEPRSSKVLLASSGSGDDGELSAEEVARLDLHALDAVVLSACGSALGYASATRGALALSNAFLEAGAHQVVASLWDLDDEAAQEISRGLYAQVLEGRDLSDALRRARAAARRSASSRSSSPRSWAALRLIVAAPWSDASPGQSSNQVRAVAAGRPPAPDARTSEQDELQAAPKQLIAMPVIERGSRHGQSRRHRRGLEPIRTGGLRHGRQVHPGVARSGSAERA